jgi:hypothetical protein
MDRQGLGQTKTDALGLAITRLDLADCHCKSLQRIVTAKTSFDFVP